MFFSSEKKRISIYKINPSEYSFSTKKMLDKYWMFQKKIIS